MPADLINRQLAVTTADNSLEEIAKTTAKKLKLNYLTYTESQTCDYLYLLILTEDRIELHSPKNKKQKPFWIDFCCGKFGYRWQHAQVRNELVAKAVGIKKNYHPMVIDTTAGLGRDSFLLASLGCPVIMIERSPIFALLLNDGLRRFRTADKNRAEKLKLNLLECDALDYLSNLESSEQPDVIYLDPMFPERTQSALVKKEMRILQDLVGPDLDSKNLFQTALRKAKKRIVVKRPSHAETIDQTKPDFVYSGKNIRFDIYIPVVLDD